MFTCISHFPREYVEQYEIDKSEPNAQSQFGSGNELFPNLVFYASIHSCSSWITVSKLCDILVKIRNECYPPPSHGSVLSPEEDAFVTDVIDCFPAMSPASQHDVKKKILKSILNGNAPNEDVQSYGKDILGKSYKLVPEIITRERLAEFVMFYLSNGFQFFSSVERAAGALYEIVAMFASLNAPVPGRVARRFAWLDKLADRIRKSYLIHEICFYQVPSSPGTLSPSAAYDKYKEEVTRSLFSPAVKKFAEEIPKPFAWGAPRIHPQKSPVSPPKQFLDDEWMPQSHVPSMLPDPTSSIPIGRGERELVLKALLRSGMSPRRSEKMADEFLAGGSPNRNALRRTIESTQQPVSPYSESAEREKLRDIRSLVAEIRQIAERHK
jgi:hypothetical protein